ncbi:MAG TPA: hypothetical protein VH012_00390 [Acidimicrobiales bacterium]|nr:hypothetical protein [Acidimicrobiales bacterium]
MADISPPESPSQLSGVLLALAESQQLLLTKVRSVRQQHEDPSLLIAVPRVDIARQLDRPDPAPATVDTEDEEVGASMPEDHQGANGRSRTMPVPGDDPHTATLSAHDIMVSADASERRRSKDRNYNFFDDLDAKLASLDDPGDGGG